MPVFVLYFSFLFVSSLSLHQIVVVVPYLRLLVLLADQVTEIVVDVAVHHLFVVVVLPQIL